MRGLIIAFRELKGNIIKKLILLLECMFCTNIKAILATLLLSPDLNDPDFFYINETLRENCEVGIEVLGWKAADNLSSIHTIIKNEKESGNIENTNIRLR